MASLPPPARKRRWLSISLRGLLLVVTVLALYLGWHANLALRQRAAVASVLRRGGRIFYSYADPVQNPAYELATPPRLAGLLGIDFVDRVTVVEFIGPEFGDDDLRLLDDMPYVRWLRIYGTSVTGKTFEHVADRPRITVLLVNHSPLEDAALAEIGRMRHLKTLHLVDTRITDAGLGSLVELKRLESLSLSECEISDTGLASWPLPATLMEVSLENTNVSDETVMQLVSLPQLSRLTLYGSPVTDDSIATLAQMPQLKAVMLGETKVTDDGLRRLIEGRGQQLVVSPDPDGGP